MLSINHIFSLILIFFLQNIGALYILFFVCSQYSKDNTHNFQQATINLPPSPPETKDIFANDKC